MPTRPSSLRPSAPSPPQRRACGSSGRTCRSWPPSRAWKSWLLFVGAVPGRVCGATAPAADNQSTGCHTPRPINQAQEERLAACRFTRSFRGPRARQSRGCRGSLRARGTRPTPLAWPPPLLTKWAVGCACCYSWPRRATTSLSVLQTQCMVRCRGTWTSTLVQKCAGPRRAGCLRRHRAHRGQAPHGRPPPPH